MRAVDFAVVVIAVGFGAALMAGAIFGNESERARRLDEARRSRAIDAALSEGATFRVALGRPGPYRARIEIGGRVWGFATTRDLAEWLATYGAGVVLRGEMTGHEYPETVGGVEIGHPSLGGR